MHAIDVKRRYLNLGFDSNAAAQDDIESIQEVLDVKLPHDFIQISSFFSGGRVGGVENLAFSQTVVAEANLIDCTIRLRKTMKMPKEFLAISEQEEYIIVLDTLATYGDAVYRCDTFDEFGRPHDKYILKLDKWKTYLDYFNFLLDEELRIQLEPNNLKVDNENRRLDKIEKGIHYNLLILIFCSGIGFNILSNRYVHVKRAIADMGEYHHVGGAIIIIICVFLFCYYLYKLFKLR